MATINPRYFSIEEANNLLSTLTPLLEELMTRRDKVVHIQQNKWGIKLNPHLDIGGAVPSEMMREFDRIEALTAQIEGHGVIIRDLNAGLIDFLARILASMPDVMLLVGSHSPYALPIRLSP